MGGLNCPYCDAENEDATGSRRVGTTSQPFRQALTAAELCWMALAGVLVFGFVMWVAWAGAAELFGVMYRGMPR